MRKEKANVGMKIAAVFFALTFLVAAFVLLRKWEQNRGDFSGTGAQDGVLTYEGQDYVLRDDVEAFLVLGLDKFEGTAPTESYNNDKQADFLMLFVFDNDAQTCSAIHVNRDTMANVAVLGVGGEKIDTVTKQIALAHTYGNGQKISCRNTKDAVEDLLLGIHINHYVSFTMDSVAAMNDFVGGVPVTLTEDLQEIDSSFVKGETVTLMGEQALRFVRTRYGLEDSSNATRMKRQQQYISALHDKTLACMETDNEFIVKLADKMDEYVVYDSSDQRMQKYAEKIEAYQFLGTREIEGESKVGEEFMEFYPNQDNLYKTVIDLFYKLKN